ncbi:GNAT family N-acetyltransferase [Fodinisporobacter ferrooxydans]|uniref:GNAT family N-acetyltransferase n=1 Tax=Fodinisporobacter ferrooxydans TaxID=2901836 RepID=A0ABY4CU43_9BACL|nr:GNAT family N-acetyltransferase [Alicyclobacillaceae bacterium MYW30-H2]
MVSDKYEVSQNNFVLSTDRNRMDVDVVCKYLHDEAYWCKGIPRDVAERSIQNSLCFGIYHGVEQVGFARVISDFATFAYLGDVFVLPAYRGQGLSKWMMECIMGHPLLQGLRKFQLVTRDAHGLYEKYGFTRIVEPERHMEKTVPANQLYGRDD